MITKLVKRYYCEHCRKGGMTKAIAKHEDSCIRNPARICATCLEFAHTGLGPQVPMPDLLEAAKEASSCGLGALKDLTECPTCILSALVQHRKSNPRDEWVEFDYKAEMGELRNSPREYPEPIHFR